MRSTTSKARSWATEIWSNYPGYLRMLAMISLSHLRSLSVRCAASAKRWLSARASSIAELADYRASHLVVSALCLVGGIASWWVGANWQAMMLMFLCGGTLRGAQIVHLLNLFRAMREAHDSEIRALMAINSAEVGKAIAQNIAQELERLRSGEPPEKRTLQ